MDSSSLSSLFFMVLLLCLSAYFSATETAFSSLNRSRMKNMADRGDRRARLVLDLADQYDKLLSTILVGNNIVNISLSSVATVFFIAHFGNIGATLSTAVVTVVVLIFGEISPKSLAKEAPEQFALAVAPVLRALMALLTPVNWLFSQWKKLLSRLIKTPDDRRVTQEELLTIVEEAASEGGIDQQESELIKSAIEFGDQRAQDILTPRVDVVGVSHTADAEQVAQVFVDTGFSRVPVYDGSLDEIVGIIHQKDFYRFVLSGGQPLESVVKPAVYVAPAMPIQSLLKTLQKAKAHMAVVTDEFGGTMGIVTMEDILEELVGEIWDEHEEILKSIERREDGQYLVSCLADLDELYRFFGLKGEMAASTVGGWVLDALGKVPELGDSFQFQNLSVKVADVQHQRALSVLITVQP